MSDAENLQRYAANTDSERRCTVSLLKLLLVFVLLLLTSMQADAQTVEDLKRFPQTAAAYLPADADKPIANFENQRAYADEYRVRHFAPWQSVDLSFLDLTWDNIRKLRASFVKKELFDKNGKLFPASEMSVIISNATLGLNLQSKPAIMVKDTDVRALPTDTPLYPSRVSALGERGFLRADSLQNSATKPGEPVSILSHSADDKWFLIASPAVLGWVKRDSVALVDPDFMDKYTESPLAVFVKDNVRIRDERGALVATAKMGTVIPCDGDDLLFPVRGKHGEAHIKRYRLGKSVTAPFPVSLTPNNAVRAIDQLLGERYGWGGSYSLRDCSAVTKDYFSLFGVWLPKNSGDQAKVGASIPISGMTASQKTHALISRGVPFATLLYMKGHIMLYMGTYDGEPVILHSIWGVPIKARDGRSGRVVIGKTAVTSLYVGRELKNRRSPLHIINNISSLVFPMANMW